ncbi:glycine zipper 2TM domain-containing protein [Dyella acidiphila]|uniref:Glycine zipper 2TM domain-containing protein n=1 Tax=Dyella acidiphila TaxID=2775866 RepID=A0ABR9GCS1_9GAMM|nr:glycine zipper 2TM domain-containing protein [Dyella acidiphila]MBE1161837.1 glycine zipper 2TM domain-containing protein [Dyella acidiphila]
MKSLSVFALAALLAGGCAGLHAQSTYSTPQSGTREVCHTVQVEDAPKDNHQIAGTAVGAVAGGLLGHTVGKGKGNLLATAGGVVAGGYAGKKVQENHQANHPTYHYEKRCHQE